MYVVRGDQVNISSEQLFNKMEELLQKAKNTSNEEAKKGYVIAIQALCELVTGEKNESKSVLKQPPASLPLSMSMEQRPSQTNMSLQQKPLELEDANGSSLLDF